MIEGYENLSAISAEELARRAQAGSSACFDALVQRFARRVWRYLRGRGLSDHDADDVAQETFIKAFRYLNRYDAKQRFAPWLFTIATRGAVSFYRSRKSAVDVDSFF